LALEAAVETIDPKKLAAVQEACVTHAEQCFKELGVKIPASKRVVIAITLCDDSAVLDLPAWNFFSQPSLKQGGCPCLYSAAVSAKMHRRLRQLADRLGQDVGGLKVGVALKDRLFTAASLQELLPSTHYAGLVTFMSHHQLEFM
jgi:hypothetical protein